MKKTFDVFIDNSGELRFVKVGEYTYFDTYFGDNKSIGQINLDIEEPKKPEPDWEQLLKDNPDGVKVLVGYYEDDVTTKRYLKEYSPKKKKSYCCYQNGQSKFSSDSNTNNWKFCKLWIGGEE